MGKRKSKKKKDGWICHEVGYSFPGKKKVIAYSAQAVSDFIDVMARNYDTIKDIYEAINYDLEAKEILKIYIDAGYGDKIARQFFKEWRSEKMKKCVTRTLPEYTVKVTALQVIAKE